MVNLINFLLLKKEDHSSRIPVVAVVFESLSQRAAVNRKNLLPSGSKFFQLIVALSEKGGKYLRFRATSLEMYPCTENTYIRISF